MYCGICGLISFPSSSTAAGAIPAFRAWETQLKLGNGALVGAAVCHYVVQEANPAYSLKFGSAPPLAPSAV